jgi:uncharacterized protein DUF2059
MSFPSHSSLSSSILGDHIVSIRDLAMISARLQLSALFVLLAAFPVFAESMAEEVAIAELTDLSGLTQQIPHIPKEYLTFVDQMLMGLERQRYPVSRSLGQRIRQSFKDALAPDRMEAEIRLRLRQGLSQDTIQEAVKWLQSDLGKKITAAEGQGGSEEKAIELATFVMQLQLERLDPQRLELARRIEEITQGSEMATDAWEAVVTGVGRALEIEYRARGLQAQRKLEEYVASVRASVKGMFHQGRLIHVLFTYRSLTDDEFEQYVQFLDTPHGRSMSKAMNSAVHGAAIDAIQGLQASLFRTKPPPPPMTS